MGFFNPALATGQVANFNFIIPNGCEDGEANCGPIHNRYTQFDAFLRREVTLIQQSPAFGSNDVIIVVYDEDERAGGLAKKNGFGEGGHVVCAILSPMAVPGTYDSTLYHYSLLRAIEDGFRSLQLRRLRQRCNCDCRDLVLIRLIANSKNQRHSSR